MISQLYLYPNGYGVVVLVGLISATIICYVHICGFVTYNQVSHNSCNMVTRGFPDIYTLSPHDQVYISDKPLFPMIPCYNYIIPINSLKVRHFKLPFKAASYIYICCSLISKDDIRCYG